MLSIVAASEKFENLPSFLKIFSEIWYIFSLIDPFSHEISTPARWGEGVYPPFSLTAVFPAKFFEAEYMYTSPHTEA